MGKAQAGPAHNCMALPAADDHRRPGRLTPVLLSTACASATVPGGPRLINAGVHRARTGSTAADISGCARLIDPGVDHTTTRRAHARRRRGRGRRRPNNTAHGNTRRRAVDHRRASRRTIDTARRNTRRRAVDLGLSDGGDGAEAGGPKELAKSVSHCVLLATERRKSILLQIPIAAMILGFASVARLGIRAGYLTQVKREFTDHERPYSVCSAIFAWKKNRRSRSLLIDCLWTADGRRNASEATKSVSAARPDESRESPTLRSERPGYRCPWRAGRHAQRLTWS
jgi:hypothetical protein